jgi:hypothetical protein
MSVLDVLKRVPDIGREFVAFIVRPREYARNWKSPTHKSVPSKEVATWCFGTVFLALALYTLAFGSIWDDALKVWNVPIPHTSTDEHKTSSVPSIGPIVWMRPGYGMGLSFPQIGRISDSDPQAAIFSFGMSQVGMLNVVPDSLAAKHSTLLIVGLYAVVSILCLHLPARVLGGFRPLSDVVRLALNYSAFVCLFTYILALSGTTILYHLFGLKLWMFTLSYASAVLLPALIVAVRGFFSMFSEIYGFSKRRLFLAWLASNVITSLLGPILVFPGIYAIIRITPLLEALL